MNDRGWTDWDLSRPREEWGAFEVGGYHINGKKPSELIQSGQLTVETIKPEERQVVYDDFMMGYTRDKEMMAKKIDLMMDDSELINQVVFNQYKLAVSEMRNEHRGYIDHTPRDRKFQFLATVKMLMEKGYDIDSLHFNRNSGQVGLAELLADFRKNCDEYHARSIEDPSWFKDGQRPANFDMRRVNNPWLFAGTLITEVYEKNPAKFEVKYENYKATTRVPAEEMLTYEDYMHYGYGIKVPARINNLEQFKNAREAQMESDKKLREQQLINLKQPQPVQYDAEVVDVVEGHKSK